MTFNSMNSVTFTHFHKLIAKNIAYHTRNFKEKGSWIKHSHQDQICVGTALMKNILYNDKWVAK